ncbi:MAG: HEPN domain-containing protein, partial [Thermofilaceae archaeon]
LEQYCQLALKCKLLLKTGSYPRTRSLRRLVRELGRIAPELLTLVEDEVNLHYVARLEEAYVAARYMPYSYEEKEVKSLYRFVVEKFKPLVEKVV